MNRLVCALVPAVVAAAAGHAQAFVFTLAPVTNTTPNFASPILIQGTVTVAPGETFLAPTVMSTVHLPFLANFSAGFNGSGQMFDPGFLAWNGIGTYTGPIYNHQVSANNLGFSGGMPVGLYGSNVLGPGGNSGIILSYINEAGLTQSVAATYAVNVIPAPGAAAAFGIGALFAARRRR